MADDEHRNGSGVRIDPRRLRALAHPLRMRILNILAAEGPATSTTLGRRLGQSTGTLSWHLRHLAEHGLIEEDPERGTRRERWWRTPPGQVLLEGAELFDAPQLRGPLSAVLQETAAYHFQLVGQHWAQLRSGQLSREWADASAMIGSGGVAMSPAQLSALNRELLQVIEEHSRAAKRAPHAGAQRVVVLLHSFPVADDVSPAVAPPVALPASG
jgi:DNA-binding transcriptional ArsR family regulator